MQEYTHKYIIIKCKQVFVSLAVSHISVHILSYVILVTCLYIILFIFWGILLGDEVSAEFVHVQGFWKQPIMVGYRLINLVNELKLSYIQSTWGAGQVLNKMSGNWLTIYTSLYCALCHSPEFYLDI